MSHLLGVTQSSMLQLQQNMLANNILVSSLYYDLKLLKKPSHLKKFKASQVMLVSGVRAYNSALTLLNEIKCPIVIFDSPALLSSYPNIELLDTNMNDNVLNYSFGSRAIDYTKLYKYINNPKDGHELLTRTKKDLLEDIIKLYSINGILEKFNTYIYATTTPLHRTKVKDLLVKYMFGKLDLAGLHKSLAIYVKEVPKNMQLLRNVTEYLDTAPGQQLKKALLYAQDMENNAKVNSRRTVAYKKIGELFGIDHFELRNIILLYRNSKA